MVEKEVQLIGQRYILGEVVGKGAFGSVYKAKDIKNKDNLVAIKRINRDQLNKIEYLRDALNREIEIMNLIKCENSVQIIDVIQTTSNINLVLELCDGDIDDWLNKHKGYITEDELKEILLGLNGAFRIMEEKNIAHRDLKLKNILYVKTDREDYKESKIIPKLADYGFSKVVDENDMTSTRLGSPITMAPEIHSGQQYTSQCDIWSMGVIIYQLLYKALPFKAKNELELKLQISKFVKLKIPDGFSMSKELYDLVSKMLVVDPNRRIKWEDYFKHPFFKIEKKINNDKNKVNNVANDNKDKDKEKNKDKETDMEKFERKYGPSRKLTDDPNGGYLISKAKSKLDGKFVFIKEYDRLIIDSVKEYKDIFDYEVKLLQNISIDEKAKSLFPVLYDFFVSETKYIIITEYFEGKPLESYLNKRSLLEDYTVLEIIKQIIPALEYLNTNKIVLSSFTTKSLWFHSYKDEKNFKIKFFDLGISRIYNDPSFERTFSLLEEPSEKTNVLNFGLILYRLCLGQNLFEFSINEDPKQTIQKKKGIKLNRSISKQLKNLIEKSCFTNPNKRYSLSELIKDPYITQLKDLQNIDNNDFLKSLNLNKKENLDIKLNDFKVENIAESILGKVENIIEYFSQLLGIKLTGDKSKLINQKKPIENFIGNYNEMCIFTSLIYLELQELKNFLTGSSFKEDFSELSLLKLNEKNYEYSIANFFNDKITINLENPKLEEYLKSIEEKRNQLIYIIDEIMKLKDKRFDDDKCFDNLSDLMKNFYHHETEMYFFVLFDNATNLHSKGDYEKAYDEFLISKYYYEIILFIRMVSHSKVPTVNFIQASEDLECEDFINIGNESKFSHNENNCVMITFLGSIFKIFKEGKIIEENLMTESTITFSKDVVEGLISFATQLLCIISNCANNKN